MTFQSVAILPEEINGVLVDHLVSSGEGQGAIIDEMRARFLALLTKYSDIQATIRKVQAENEQLRTRYLKALGDLEKYRDEARILRRATKTPAATGAPKRLPGVFSGWYRGRTGGGNVVDVTNTYRVLASTDNSVVLHTRGDFTDQVTITLSQFTRDFYKIADE